MSTKPGLRLRQKVAIALLPNLLLFGLAEATARIVYYRRSGNLGYLLTPFRLGKETETVADRKAYPAAGSENAFTYRDDCSGREVVWTINALGVRGGAWRLEKEPGAVRILTLGGSTTLGMKNPDWATYPLFLEQALRRDADRKVEVLNGAWVGVRLADIIHLYRTKLAAYRPDIVIFYEGWNDTPKTYLSQDVNYDVLRVHRDSRLGRMASRLYYRSLLYTYLIEKIQFQRARQYRKNITPRTALFQSEMERLTSLIRESGAVPVFVLQVSNSRFVPEVSRLDLQDPAAVRRFVVRGAYNDRRTEFDQRLRLRFYQGQVVEEMIRRMGEKHGIQVIDPWPTFGVYPPGEPLFCGPIHLTDLGNRLLAETVSERLFLPTFLKTAQSDPDRDVRK